MHGSEMQKVLVGKHEGKRPRHMWEDNIKWIFKTTV
jgi:hypothetical protein